MPDQHEPLTPYEQEAEQAFARRAEIDQAAQWCRQNYPHKFEFLNSIYEFLTAEERHYAHLGLTEPFRIGAVRTQPVLGILTPSQALRLLEAYKRAIANDPQMWKARRLADIDRIESDRRRDAVVAAVKEELTRENRGGKRPK